jgi:hypothetical protein
MTVDGQALAGGSSLVELTAGRSHELVVSAPGYRPFRRSVRVPVGATVVIHARLTRAR